jgi:hypothetical protein
LDIEKVATLATGCDFRYFISFSEKILSDKRMAKNMYRNY